MLKEKGTEAAADAIVGGANALVNIEQEFLFLCLVEDFVQAQVKQKLEAKQLAAKLAESEIAQELCTKWTCALVKSALKDLYRQSEEEAEFTVENDGTTSTLVFKMEYKDVNYTEFALPDEEAGGQPGAQQEDSDSIQGPTGPSSPRKGKSLFDNAHVKEKKGRAKRHNGRATKSR